MKKIMLLTSLAGGLFAATMLLAADEPATNATPPDAMATNAPSATADQPDQTPQPAADADSAPATATVPAAATVIITPAPDTNVIVVVPTGVKGLRMNFRGAPLEAVLNYLSAAAGFIINAQVPVTGKVTVWSEQPMDSKEAVALLQQMLSQNGFTAIQDGRTLTILRSDDAKTSYVRTVFGSDPDAIPKNAEIVTQVIPVHSLNVIQLVKDLQPLKSPEATLTADESANALVMTGPQISIRRITEVVRALDSVTSSSATISVFPLQYADAKATADLIKDLFPNPDTQRNGAGGGFNFGRFRGGGGGGGGGFNPFGGGGGGGGDAENNGHTPTAKVSAVSDDHSNTLIVSAPDSMMETISNLVHELDKVVDETTEEHTFHLKNADPMEMVSLLTSLFPDDSGGADATRQSPFRFGFPGAQQPAANTPSDRAKKIAHVVAVADPRTSSLLVTAGKDVMAGIITIVNDLDARNDRKQTAHVFSLQNADPAEVQQILQQLFPSSSTGSAQAALTVPTTGIDPFADRRNTQLQLQNAQNPANFGGVSGSGTGTGRTTGN